MERPLLSACLIVRDEEERLGRCLTALSPIAEELVVADTGSTDRTPELARRFGARVFDVPWNDDFAAARNACLARARGEWLLVVDADEVLENPDRAALRNILAAAEGPAFSVEIASPGRPGGEEVAHVTRLFRNDPRHRYRGRVHEQILPAIAEALGRDVWTPPRSGLRFRHDGYLPGLRARRSKLERNRRLLELEIAAHPSDPGPRFFLARETVAAAGGDLLDLPGTRRALEVLEPAVERLLEIPQGGLTDPLLALGIRLAAVTGRTALAESWSRRAETKLGRTARWLYADGERLLAEAPFDPAAARSAAERFERAIHAPEGSPQLMTPRALRRSWAPLRRDVAAELGGLAAASSRGAGDSVELRLIECWRRARGGEPLAALPPLQEALRRDRGDPRLWLALALVCRLAGREELVPGAVATALAAAPGWQAALRLREGDPGALRGLLAPWRPLLGTPLPVA